MNPEILALAEATSLYADQVETLTSTVTITPELLDKANSVLSALQSAAGVLLTYYTPGDEPELPSVEDLLLSYSTGEVAAEWEARFERVGYHFLRVLTSARPAEDEDELLALMTDFAHLVLVLEHVAIHIPNILDTLSQSA